MYGREFINESRDQPFKGVILGPPSPPYGFSEAGFNLPSHSPRPSSKPTLPQLSRSELQTIEDAASSFKVNLLRVEAALPPKTTLGSRLAKERINRRVNGFREKMKREMTKKRTAMERLQMQNQYEESVTNHEAHSHLRMDSGGPLREQFSNSPKQDSLESQRPTIKRQPVYIRPSFAPDKLSTMDKVAMLVCERIPPCAVSLGLLELESQRHEQGQEQDNKRDTEEYRKTESAEKSANRYKEKREVKDIGQRNRKQVAIGETTFFGKEESNNSGDGAEREENEGPEKQSGKERKRMGGWGKV